MKTLVSTTLIHLGLEYELNLKNIKIGLSVLKRSVLLKMVQEIMDSGQCSRKQALSLGGKLAFASTTSRRISRSFVRTIISIAYNVTTRVSRRQYHASQWWLTSLLDDEKMVLTKSFSTDREPQLMCLATDATNFSVGSCAVTVKRGVPQRTYASARLIRWTRIDISELWALWEFLTSNPRLCANKCILWLCDNSTSHAVFVKSYCSANTAEGEQLNVLVSKIIHKLEELGTYVWAESHCCFPPLY